MAPLITPLIVGGGNASGAVEAGTVSLELIDGQLHVIYKLYDEYTSNSTTGDSRDDWGISEIHFDFGEVMGAFPLTKSGNPQVGRFDFGGRQVTFEPTNTSSEIKFAVDKLSTDDEFTDLKLWAAHAVVSQRPAIQAFNESLPTRLNFKLTDGPDQDLGAPPEDSYWEVTVSGSTEEWLNGTFKAWCVDVGGTANEGNVFDGNIFSSIADDLTGIPVDKPLNFDRVNWLLNNAAYLVGKEVYDNIVYGGASASNLDYADGGMPASWTDLPGTASLGSVTFSDIQRAIWALIDSSSTTAGLGPSSTARVDELADMAYVYGNGYVPGCDDTVAVILQPDGTNKQVVIGQVVMAETSYPCSGSSETGWAITDGIAGLGGANRFGSSWAEYNSSQLSLA